MDPLDFAVYRYLSPGGQARFWAGRRLIDPRTTPREVAERVGISENAVRTRLHRLTAQGFLKDSAVVLNPSLLGSRVFVKDLVVRQPGEVDRILRDLDLVEGVIFARDLMDEVERSIQVYFVSESEAAAARFGALLGRLSPTGAPTAPRAYYIPPCDRELSPLDWRVLSGILLRPTARFGEVASNTGISLKTAGRIYHHLIDSRACWWTHGPESEEYPLALVRVDLRTPQDRDAVVGWLGREALPWMPVASDGFGQPPETGSGLLVGLVPADVPAALERFLRKLAVAEGVARVHRTFALGSVIYSAWFAERIASRAATR